MSDITSIPLSPTQPLLGSGAPGDLLPSSSFETVTAEVANTSSSDAPGQGFPSEENADKDGIFWEKRKVSAHNDKGELVSLIEDVRCKRCSDCGLVIGLGQGKGLNAYNKHFRSVNCLNTSKNKRAVASQKGISSFFKPRLPQQSIASSSTSITDGSSTLPLLSQLLCSSFVDLSEEPLSQLSNPSPTPRSDSESWTTVDQTMAIFSQFTCMGIEFSFTDSIYLKYPWHLHHFEHLPYHFSAIEEKGTKFRIRSNSCFGMAKSGKTACFRCESLTTSSEIERLQERAKLMPASGTNYRYYSFDQLCTLLAEKNRQINSWKLQVSC
jgi:hypothetical protein